MKETKLSIFLSCILSVMACPAMKYQIKVLNTPTIIIDNKSAKVGDWFDDNSEITWSKDNQSMRVVSEDNRIYTLSASLYKEAKAKKFSDFIAYTKPLAVRGVSSADFIDQLSLRFEQDFVLLDVLVIDLSDLDLPNDCYFEFIGMNPSGKDLSIIKVKPDKGVLTIDRSQIDQNFDYDTSIQFGIIFYDKNSKPIVISDQVFIDIIN